MRVELVAARQCLGTPEEMDAALAHDAFLSLIHAEHGREDALHLALVLPHELLHPPHQWWEGLACVWCNFGICLWQATQCLC